MCVCVCVCAGHLVRSDAMLQRTGSLPNYRETNCVHITDIRKKIYHEDGKSNYLLNDVNSYQNTRWHTATQNRSAL